MKHEVIEIPSDNEEQQRFKSKEIAILQRQIEDEAALLRSNTGLMLAINKRFIDGTPKEKDQILAQRIKKMFIDKANFDISKEHFCLKREPNYNHENCQLELNSLLVFGTDFWPTRQIKNDSSVLKLPIEVMRIDDSHCKLKFINHSDALKWLDIYILDKEVKSKIEEEEQQMNDQVPEQNKVESAKLKGWFKLQNYFYQGFERAREARFCTSLEKNLKEMIEDTKTTNYLKFKEQIEKEMLKDDQVKISYQMAEERNRYQKKYRNDGHSRYKQDRSYRSNYNGFTQRSREKNETYRYQKHPRQRQGYGHRRHHDREVRKSTNKTTIHAYPSTKERHGYQESSTRLHQSNLLEGTGNKDSNSLSFLLDNNDNLNSITDALKKMDLEEGQLDLSVQLAPVADFKPNLDTSVMIGPVAQNSKADKLPQLNTHNLGMKASYKPKPKNEDSKKKEPVFDYLKYIEQSEQQLTSKNKDAQ